MTITPTETMAVKTPTAQSQKAPNVTVLQEVADTTVPDPTMITNLCATLHNYDMASANIGYLACPANRYRELRPLQQTQNPSPLSAEDVVSLETLFAPPAIHSFSLKQRYNLALVLASTLLQLQTTPWTNGRFSKRDIFFRKDSSRVATE